MKLKIERIRDVKMPEKAYPNDAGFDCFIPNDIGNIEQWKQQDYGYMIPSGLKVQIPENYCLIFFNRSSIARSGYSLGACVIDQDYRGEVFIHIIASTHSKKYLKLEPGIKIAQMLLLPVPKVEIVEDIVNDNTDRSSGGFGSSGFY